MTNDQPLAGKRAMIMGAPGDAGEAIALALATAGADVALTTATHDAEEAFALRRITRGVKALGRRSMNESVDMSIGTGVQIAMRQVAKELGGIDIVIAGPDIRVDKPADRLTDADWSRLVNTNLSAVYFACRSAYRELQANEPPGGHIVILLPSAETVSVGGPAYGAVRAGVEALVRGLAEEWAGSGVFVTALTAGSETIAAAVLQTVAK